MRSDLPGQPQVELDVDELRGELARARIAITGAAGSIGSELTRQLVKLNPAVQYLIDPNENDLYFCATSSTARVYEWRTWKRFRTCGTSVA
jgi:FlaA1/EpsC-like NDP-sugar epimerase